jgi:hypothetical protein
MSDQDAIAKLDRLIEFYKNYNNMFSELEMRQEIPLAA